ncbi:MAG: uracil-xanthine permease [Clostridia bacterium]|nr:uracil-xanthine permease [Clostridia bacterium]
MKLIYGVKDKPKAGQIIVFALQQLLAIMAATIAVPMIVGNGMSTSAALFGAGVGTLVYLLFTKFKSPVFLGSSFAFLGSMGAAFAGAASISVGYFGLIIGADMAGLIYVIIALIVKLAGTKWINKLMPAVVIGPTVAIIGLSLAGGAIKDVLGGNGTYADKIYDATLQAFVLDTHATLCMVCGIITLLVTVICSVFGKKMLKMIPFIIGILSGYAVALVITIIGTSTGNNDLVIINFDSFKALAPVRVETFVSLPQFSFIEAFKDLSKIDATYIASIAVGYIPVAFVVFAEHLADHKNISSIIEHDLLEDPGLHRTLLGDGVGSIAGAFFGGCPNTTYGESIGCVAISGNASVITILFTAIFAICISFLSPFVAFLSSIPSCVMGGVCIALYGFIAVSGLKMVQKADLGDNRNLFVVSVILIAGVGGMALGIPIGNDRNIKLTSIAVALILGIVTNLILSAKKNKEEKAEAEEK